MGAVVSRCRMPPGAKLLIALIASALYVAPADAQRVQFPSVTPSPMPLANGAMPPTPAPALTYGAPSGAMPGFDPYANSALGAPPLDVPYATPPTAVSPFGAAPTGAPVYGAPSQFGAPSPFGAPPANNPAAPLFGQPIPQSTAPPTGAYSQNWNWPATAPASTYSYQNPDGAVVRVQRLLQQFSFEQTYLYGDHGPGNFAVNRTELAATFGFPFCRNPDTPLLITPGFAFNWWEGPVDPGTDLPPRAYDAYLDAAWHPKFTPSLGADLGVRTGVWTDFNAVNNDSIRILGRGLGVITISPQFDILAGVWYLDRNEVKLLPAGGVHWRPNPDCDAYIVFPNPKLRRRFVNVGTSQWWWYVAGEYGGGRWTVRRASGISDDIDYNDVRVFGGLEWQTQTQLRGHVEIGYVFNRQIVYTAGQPPPIDNLDDTFMIRAGADF